MFINCKVMFLNGIIISKFFWGSLFYVSGLGVFGNVSFYFFSFFKDFFIIVGLNEFVFSNFF